MAEIDLIKISELPATSTIGDADELAVVQGGATKKVPYSVLKDGAEVTPDTTLSEAGVPADAAAVGAALALKANQAAVTQALAAKADKTEVAGISGDIEELASVVERKADQTALNQKADKTTTDALRQDLTTLNGIVNQKADKTELNTQIGNVTAELATKANTADVNNLLAAKANVASPVFTGRPQAPTAAKGTATLQLATTAFVQNAIDDKQDTLTFDAAPTQGSTNPVTSGGVYTALEDAKDDTETAIAEVREESEEATAEAKAIALKAFATPTASGQLLTLTDGADGIPAKGLTLNLSPHQSGSGDPSPDNVRSISGYTAVKVTRAGKNVLPANWTSATINGITFTKNDDGTVTASGTSTEVATRGMPVSLKAGRYVLSGCPPTGGSSSTYEIQINNGGTYYHDFGSGTAFTIDNDASVSVLLVVRKNQTVSNLAFKPMIRSASFTDDTYEPYTGEEYDITIPTAAGTVYGGQLTVDQDGSGTLVVDRGFVTLNGTETWTRTEIGEIGTSLGLIRLWTSVSGVLANKKPTLCNQLPTRNDQTWTTQSPCSCRTEIVERYEVVIDTAVYADARAWKAHLAQEPLQAVFYTTPTAYTLTAEQVTTLLGNNTLWMDADGTIDLEYRADTTLYINNLITGIRNNIAYIEDGTTASRAYSVGQYVLISGQLYKVTSAIASGATFTVGTNVVATTVGTELTALN